MSEIKECPFCGGEAYVVKDETQQLYKWRVECSCCFANTDNFFEMKKAVEAWNRREDK